MLARFNQFIEKWIFLVTPVCVILGVVFSDITIHGNVLVPYVFAVMTFIGALKSSFQDIVHVFRHPLPLLLSMVCIHIIMPVLAFGAEVCFFRQYQSDYWDGAGVCGAKRCNCIDVGDDL